MNDTRARGPFPVTLRHGRLPLADTSSRDGGLVVLQALGAALVGSVIAILVAWWIVWFVLAGVFAVAFLAHRGRLQKVHVGDRGLRVGLWRQSWADLRGARAGTFAWLEEVDGRELEREAPGVLLEGPDAIHALWTASAEDADAIVRAVEQKRSMGG